MKKLRVFRTDMTPFESNAKAFQAGFRAPQGAPNPYPDGSAPARHWDHGAYQRLAKLETIRDPAAKAEETWRVVVNGTLTTPSFNSKGAALAYESLIRQGARQPEFAK